jgi:Tol biopolymer transport system component
VAFTSGAPNLVTGEANDVTNLFVRDRIAGTTTQINLDSSGRPGTADVDEPAISADGRHVAFTSFDDGLVDDDTNHSADVLVHDLGTGVTTRVSVNSAGEGGDSESWAPFISADGRYVAFRSLSRNLVENQFSAGSYLHDRVTGITTRVSGGATTLWISANNRYVASTDFHVSVFDRATGTTTIADVGSQGQLADRGSGSVSLSADGRYVAFSSAATNLVAGDDNGHTDIFVRDIAAGTTTRAAGGNGDSDHVTISADGRLISFVSAAGDLVPGDTNGAADVFVVDRHTRVVQRVSVGSDGTQANGGTETASLAAGGRFVAFVSDATNLTPATPDTNDSLDVYVHELAAASVAEAFQQAAGGMVSMEAEHFDAALPGAELAPWAVVEGLRSSGGAAIRADRAWPRTTSVVESPRNEYRVDFRYAGPHYVWVRARAYRPQSDAFYVGLDDGPLQVRHVEPDDFQWVWIRAWRTIDVDSVGIHTFRLYRGERSVWVDKILITPWPGFSPKWSGPPESPRAG